MISFFFSNIKIEGQEVWYVSNLKSWVLRSETLETLETAGRLPVRWNFVVKSTRECTVVKSLTSTNQLTQLTRFENLLVSQLLKEKKKFQEFYGTQLV
jgi:hypothetical protein